MGIDGRDAAQEANARWLRTIRAYLDLDQEAIGRVIGVGRTTVTMIETGQRKLQPSHIAKLLLEFSDKLPLPPPSGDVQFMPMSTMKPQATELPYAGVVPCSSNWGDPLTGGEPMQVDAKFVAPDRFLCRVVGDSCYPALKQGDLTVWEQDTAPNYGVIVLAERSDDHACTVKKLVYDDGEARQRLVPVNPAHTSPPDDEGWGVVARLVGVIRSEDGGERTWLIPGGIRPEVLLKT
jgi:DNA-binding XRE family transcriptional regulator